MNSDVTDDWPSLGQELSRKALTALEEAVWNYEQGDIDKKALRAVVNALTDTVMGLVDKDVTDTIYGVRKELELG